MTAVKGSARRPQTIADEQFAARWDAIFGKDLCASEDRVKESDEIYTDAQAIRDCFEKDDCDDPK